MKKKKSRFDLEIGTVIKRGDILLKLVEIRRGEGIFHRSYRGMKKVFESINIVHIFNCPGTYEIIGNGNCIYKNELV